MSRTSRQRKSTSESRTEWTFFSQSNNSTRANKKTDHNDNNRCFNLTTMIITSSSSSSSSLSPATASVPPSSPPPSFQQLHIGLQRNAALQQRVFGARLSSPDVCVQRSSQYPRLLVQQLGVLTGQLCCALANLPLEASEQLDYFLSSSTSTSSTSAATTTSDGVGVDPAIPQSMVHLLLGLIQLTYVLNIDFHGAILQKMELNNRKYPAELCKGKAGKYTEYSQVTGITKTTGQTTRVMLHSTPERKSSSTSPHNDSSRLSQDSPISVMEESVETTSKSIADIMEKIRHFALERQWEKYHLPRNLVLALMGELGELAELFQWRHDDTLMQWDDEVENQPMMMMMMDSSPPHPSTTTLTTTTTDTNNNTKEGPLSRDKVQQEIADVAIYLLRLADVCHIKLDQCAWHLVHQEIVE